MTTETNKKIVVKGRNKGNPAPRPCNPLYL